MKIFHFDISYIFSIGRNFSSGGLLGLITVNTTGCINCIILRLLVRKDLSSGIIWVMSHSIDTVLKYCQKYFEHEKLKMFDEYVFTLNYLLKNVTILFCTQCKFNKVKEHLRIFHFESRINLNRSIFS